MRQFRKLVHRLIVVFASGKCYVFAANPASNVRLVGVYPGTFRGHVFYNRALCGIGIACAGDVSNVVSVPIWPSPGASRRPCENFFLRRWVWASALPRSKWEFVNLLFLGTLSDSIKHRLPAYSNHRRLPAVEYAAPRDFARAEHRETHCR